MTTSEITKAIQRRVGVREDGIWGLNTAKAVLEALEASDAFTEAAEEQEAEDNYTPLVPLNVSWKDLYEDDAVTYQVHDKCVKVLNVFETGKPEGDYSNVSIYKDGGGGKYQQITYGASQTTQDGHLDALLKDYLERLAPMTDAKKVIKGRYPTKGKKELVRDKEFIKALRDAGKEEAMRMAQDKLFDEKYFNPAYKWFHDNGFTLPLSMLVIYDSFIHSGGILSFLRKRFEEVPPAKGGDEKKWIQAYVTTRKNWLENHSNKILGKTVYRMETMQSCIDNGNWDLTQEINANDVQIS